MRSELYDRKKPLSLARVSASEVRLFVDRNGGRLSVWDRLKTGFWGSPYLECNPEDLGLPKGSGVLRVVLERGRQALFLHIHQHPDYAGLVCLRPGEIRELTLHAEQFRVRLSLQDGTEWVFSVPAKHHRSFRRHFQRWMQREDLWPMRMA